MKPTGSGGDSVQDESTVQGTAQQLRSIWPTFLLIVGIVGALGIVILGVYVTTDINVHHLVADPSEVSYLPEYTGSYSHLGVLVLWTAAILSVVTGLIVRGHASRGISATFLISFGVLLGWLAADDLFMWHEWAGLLMAKAFSAEDVDSTRSKLESIVFAVIGVVWLAWLVRFRRAILGTEYLLLFFAVAFLGASVAVDLSAYLFPSLEPETQRMQTTVAVGEELLKLTGNFLMFAYVVRMAVRVIRDAVNPRSPA